MAVRNNNRFQASVGSVSAVTNSIPCHNHRLGLVVVVPVRQQLVPNDNILAMLFLQVYSKLFNQPRLQLVYSVQSQFFNTCKALTVGFPLLGWALVATNVYVVVWENVSNVVEHTFQELYHAVIANVEHVLRNAAVHAHLVFLCRVAAELGVCSHGCDHVSGKVYLRNNFNVTLFGVCNNLAKVVL